jgi:hypothetical protein
MILSMYRQGKEEPEGEEELRARGQSKVELEGRSAGFRPEKEKAGGTFSLCNWQLSLESY